MFDTDIYVFELPVYSFSEAWYYAEYKKYKARLVEKLCRGGSDREHYQAHVEGLSFLLEEFGGGWRYNQIVGFVGILPLGCQLRGEVWLSEARSVQRKLRHKRIKHQAKGFEMTVRPDHDSGMIFRNLLDNLRVLEKSELLRRRHLDLRAIMMAGPFLNWRELIEKSTKRDLEGASMKRGNQVDRLTHNPPPAADG